MDLDDTRKPFIWRKKYEEKGIKIDEKQIELEIRKKAKEKEIELEKIKERQRKRDLEYQQKRDESEFLQRQKDKEQFEHWKRQGDDFDLKQQRLGSKIRIRDGREEKINLFDYYIDTFGHTPEGKSQESFLQEENIDLSNFEFRNPCDWFNGLQLTELEDLEQKIEKYMGTDWKENRHYWMDLLDIARSEISKMQALKSQPTASGIFILPALLGDVIKLFEGKTISELNDMREEVRAALKSNDPAIDVGFLTCTLVHLRAYRAKERLTSKHRDNMKRRFAKKTSKTNDDMSSVIKVEPMNLPDMDTSKDRNNEEDEIREEIVDLIDEKSSDDEEHLDADKYASSRRKCVEDYERGNYSPKMLRKVDLDPTIDVVDAQIDQDQINDCRRRLTHVSREERDFLDIAKKGMNNQEESTFSCEVPISQDDKHRPRKPRYFNRVHTGFEWNKYNQTHYDIDNPPPKVVQGYKFNIFYPDLIDKSKTPTITTTPCPDDEEFSIIRFSAGPPYEDIAFKIVNREWNRADKSGYKCEFRNNVLQLWFQFKRFRYRR